MGKFRDWINAEYRAFRGDNTDQAHSVSAFARLLKVEQSSLYTWMNSDTEPSSIDNVFALIEAYPNGEALQAMALKPEIIMAVVTRYGDRFRALAEAWVNLSPEKQEQLLEQIKRENGETSEATASR